MLSNLVHVQLLRLVLMICGRISCNSNMKDRIKIKIIKRLFVRNVKKVLSCMNIKNSGLIVEK